MRVAASIICLVFMACSSSKKLKYTSFMNDKNEKVLQGTINRKIIEADTAFNWFNKNYAYSQTNKIAVSVLQQNKNNFKLIAFGGTWCEDTQNLLPLFYRALDEAGYNFKNLTLVGVDRAKHSGDGLSDKYTIKNVPTFIVLNNENKEVGRVVEYGKGNGIDVELAEIIETIKKK
jgi:thiol-disulfide isomerase/thioredoxin